MASFLSAVREGVRGTWHAIRGGGKLTGEERVALDAHAKELGVGFWGRRRLAAVTHFEGINGLQREAGTIAAAQELRAYGKRGMMKAFSNRLNELRLRAASKKGEMAFSNEYNVQYNKKAYNLGALNTWRLRKLASKWGEKDAAIGFNALDVASRPAYAIRTMEKSGTGVYEEQVRQAQLRALQEQQERAQQEAQERRSTMRAVGGRQQEPQWPSADELHDNPDAHEHFMTQLEQLHPDHLHQMPEDLREFVAENYGEHTMDEILQQAEEREERRRRQPQTRQRDAA